MKHILSAALISLALLGAGEATAQDNGRRGQGWGNTDSRGRDDGYYREHRDRDDRPGNRYGHYKKKHKKDKDKWKDKEWKDRRDRDRDDDDRWGRDDRDRRDRDGRWDQRDDRNRPIIYRDRDGRPVYGPARPRTNTGTRPRTVPQPGSGLPFPPRL